MSEWIAWRPAFHPALEEKLDAETSWFIRRSSVSSTCSVQSTSVWGQLLFFFKWRTYVLQTAEKRPNVDYRASKHTVTYDAFIHERTATATPNDDDNVMTCDFCRVFAANMFAANSCARCCFTWNLCIWKMILMEIFFANARKIASKRESRKVFSLTLSASTASSTHPWNFSMFGWSVFAISRSSVKSLRLLQSGYSINLTLKLWLRLQQVVKIYFIELNAKSKATSCVCVWQLWCRMFLPPKPKWIGLGRADATHRQQTTEWIDLSIASCFAWVHKMPCAQRHFFSLSLLPSLCVCVFDNTNLYPECT